MPVVVFRVDATPSIGGGHFYRCLSLALGLRKSNADVHFVMVSPSTHIANLLSQQSIHLHTLSRSYSENSPTDPSFEIYGLIGHIDWLVIDSYTLPLSYETKVKAFASKTMIISDGPFRPHCCDLLLDQNLSTDFSAEYQQILPQPTDILLGPRYALLREEFRDCRPEKPTFQSPPKKLFICFGASDPLNYTESTLLAITRLKYEFEAVHIATTSLNSNLDQIKSIVNRNDNFILHSPLECVASILGQCDLAIGAGGSMSWERACMGVPSIAFGIAENQIDPTLRLISHGYALGSPYLSKPCIDTIYAWLTALINEDRLLQSAASSSFELVDGRGVERVASKMLNQDILFRPATSADCQQIFEWRNHSTVSQFSKSGQLPSFSDHQSWFQSQLRDPNTVLLIALSCSEPVGVVRFDITGSSATISAFKGYQSKPIRGLISAATRWLQKHHPEILRINADILAKNNASIRAFISSGYTSDVVSMHLDLPS